MRSHTDALKQGGHSKSNNKLQGNFMNPDRDDRAVSAVIHLTVCEVNKSVFPHFQCQQRLYVKKPSHLCGLNYLKCCPPCWLNAEVGKISTEGGKEPCRSLLTTWVVNSSDRSREGAGVSRGFQNPYFSAPSYSLMRDRKVTGSKKCWKVQHQMA